MKELSNEERNRQKDYAIARSPMLRFFFDSLIESDKEAWFEVVEKYYFSKEKSLEEAWGKEALDLGFAIATGENPKAFPPRATSEQKRKLFNTLTLVGYEIGDEDKTMIILEDVYLRLATYGIVSGEYGRDSVGFLFDTLYIGNSLAKGGKKEEKIPEVFADFIRNKLDLNP